VEEVPDEADAQEFCTVTPEEKSSAKRMKRRGWEKKLPRTYKIATTASAKSLRLKVQLQTTDTGEIHGTEALLDCGADGEFLDTEFV